MDHKQFDTFTRRRFAVIAGGLATFMGLGLAEHTSAKNKGGAKKKKVNQARCRADGTLCSKKDKQCQSQFCLHAPFTVEASGTSTGDQDAYLIVPPQNASTGPGPYLNFPWSSGSSQCATAYPFSCIDSGDGVTTVHKLLPGAYSTGFSSVTARRPVRSPSSCAAVVASFSSGRTRRMRPRAFSAGTSSMSMVRAAASPRSISSAPRTCLGRASTPSPSSARSNRAFSDLAVKIDGFWSSALLHAG